MTPCDQLTGRLGHAQGGGGGGVVKVAGWSDLKVSAQGQKEIGEKIFIFETFLKFANPFELESDLNFE
jgi:hypothetical protein